VHVRFGEEKRICASYSTRNVEAAIVFDAALPFRCLWLLQNKTTLSNSVPRVKERWALVNIAVLRNTLGSVGYSIRSGLSGFVFFRAIRCREQRCLRGRHMVAA
jgi:hypothetical protein